MSRPAAFRGVAGDVDKVRFLVAAGTFLRRLGGGDGVLAITATPIRQIALGADIPHKPPCGCIAAQGTLHDYFLFLGCHCFYLAYLSSRWEGRRERRISMPSKMDKPLPLPSGKKVGCRDGAMHLERWLNSLTRSRRWPDDQEA
jgi:hypothetical protein